ncbi:MAG: ATP-binding protein [Bacteroidales bacterium]|nr:ATP-binding protein [Bacteroidales bacterium]MDD4576639.1 ATP-binding protein [Bacteroidales bacterium]
MNKEKLNMVMLDQKEYFCNKRDLIERDIDLMPFLTTSQVVVISGVRRCGKSSLLWLIKDKLKLQDSNFCYFNFDDERIIGNSEILSEIYQIHLENYRTEPVFLFDEIQNVPNWEKFVNRMYEQGRKVFVTGSNAQLLSSEISSSLTGRNKVLELFPFSFIEYLSYKKHSYRIKSLTTKQKSLLLSDLSEYLEIGGFPLVLKEKDTSLINAWFQDILYRDIVSRYRLSQVKELRQMAIYLLSNSAKLFSYSTLKQISGIKSLSSIKDYLDYFERTYLLFYLYKFDYSIKKQIMNSRKVYCVDNSIANNIGLRFSDNLGRLFENMIFLELKRRGKEVYYFSVKNECDFLIKDGYDIAEAIQVVYELNYDNQKRELSGLEEAMNEFKIKQGTVITYHECKILLDLPENIQIIPAWKWLMS